MDLTTIGPEQFTGVTVEDLLLDREGRITLTNTMVAERLKLVAKLERQKPRPAPNTNCSVCNTVKGCGPVNRQCTPNTVSNCGCRLE
jgi:hypothetical protein